MILDIKHILHFRHNIKKYLAWDWNESVDNNLYIQKALKEYPTVFDHFKLVIALDEKPNISSQKPKADLRKHSRAMEMSIDDEDGTDVYEVPNISSLEYEIEVSNSNFTLGSIMPNQPIQENPIQPKRKRGRPKKHG